MKEILDEEIKKRLPHSVKTLPKYMVRWHWVLLFFLLLNSIVRSYQMDPVTFFQGILVPYVFICFISALRFLNGKINKPLFFSFHALCSANLLISLTLLGNGIFMWMVKTMGSP